jgi:hypothetical protein
VGGLLEPGRAAAPGVFPFQDCLELSMPVGCARAATSGTRADRGADEGKHVRVGEVGGDIGGTVILRTQRRGRSGGTSAGQEPVPIRSRHARQARDRQRAPLGGESVSLTCLVLARPRNRLRGKGFAADLVQRRWHCKEQLCPRASFTESLSSVRACSRLTT